MDQPACIYFGIGLIGKFSTKCIEFDANFGIWCLVRNSILYYLLGWFGYYAYFFVIFEILMIFFMIFQVRQKTAVYNISKTEKIKRDQSSIWRTLLSRISAAMTTSKYSGMVELGWAHQLTLSQPREADYAHRNTIRPQNFRPSTIPDTHAFSFYV